MIADVNALDKIPAIAKLVGCDEKLLRAANLPEESLTAIFDRVTRANARMAAFDRKVITPLGLISITAILGAQFVPEGRLKTVLHLPPMFAIVAALGRDVFKPNTGIIRAEITQAVIKRAIELSEQSNPAPRP